MYRLISRFQTLKEKKSIFVLKKDFSRHFICGMRVSRSFLSRARHFCYYYYYFFVPFVYLRLSMQQSRQQKSLTVKCCISAFNTFLAIEVIRINIFPASRLRLQLKQFMVHKVWLQSGMHFKFGKVFRYSFVSAE